MMQHQNGPPQNNMMQHAGLPNLLRHQEQFVKEHGIHPHSIPLPVPIFPPIPGHPEGHPQLLPHEYFDMDNE